MKRTTCFIIFSIPFILISCQGYERHNDNWAYYYWSYTHDKVTFPLNVDNNTFIVIKEDNYAKDKDKVFYKESLIKYANPKTFRVIDEVYSCDDKYVFFQYGIISGADPKSFVRLQFPFSKDKNDIYNGSIPLKIRKGSHFKIVENDAGIITSGIDEIFIKEYPNYKSLDTIKCSIIFYTPFSKTVAGNQKYLGIRKVKDWPLKE